MPLIERNRLNGWTLSVLVLSTIAVTGCQSGSSTNGKPVQVKRSTSEYFAESIFGVKASPRVTDSLNVRKGGGRDQIGKPYMVRGKWYYPKDQPGYVKNGKASWYGSAFHGRLTANGEVYDMNHLSAAHPTFPLPSYARVTNLETGTSVMVRVNDRGPYSHGRVMDLSSKAADFLDIKGEGTGDVKVEYLGRAPLEGDDTAMLMASYKPAGTRAIDSGLASGVMIAMNETRAGNLSFATSLATNAIGAALPGVRTIDKALAARGGAASDSQVDEMNIGSIIRGAQPASGNVAASAPIPTPRMVASYAPSTALEGAARALAAVSDGRQGERIEIGLIENSAIIEQIGKVARAHGRLILGPGIAESIGSVVLSLETNPGENVDTLLSAIWDAGAPDAFVLRD